MSVSEYAILVALERGTADENNATVPRLLTYKYCEVPSKKTAV
jgi:hypothetical protein